MAPRRTGGSRHRPTALLAGGSLATGVLAYVLFAVTTRHLGAERAAPVSVLWTYWSLAGAAVSFPLQHWVAGAISSGRTESGLRATMARLWATVLVVSVVVSALSWLVRDQLFHRQDAWFPVLVGLVTVGAALLGVARGAQTGRQRFTAVAASLVLENAIRCLAVVLLVALDVGSPSAFGAAIVAGYLVLLCWPGALRVALPGRDGAGSGPSALRLLGSSSGGQLVAQCVLTGGPVLLAVTGGRPGQVTTLFAGLALFRAPYMVALGIAPLLTVSLTSARARGDSAAATRLERLLAAGSLGLVPVAAALGALLGPWLLRHIFGDGVRLSPTEAAVLATGSAAAIANLAGTVVAMARRPPVGVLPAWSVGLLAGAVGWWLLSDVSPLARSAVVFAVVEVTTYAAMLVAQARSARHRTPAASAPAPGRVD